MNLIDVTAEHSNKLTIKARQFVGLIDGDFCLYLKTVKIQYMQEATNFSCLGDNEKAIECLHKADAIVYEQLFGIIK
jgi:hypothetical protein